MGCMVTSVAPGAGARAFNKKDHLTIIHCACKQHFWSLEIARMTLEVLGSISMEYNDTKTFCVRSWIARQWGLHWVKCKCNYAPARLDAQPLIGIYMSLPDGILNYS